MMQRNLPEAVAARAHALGPEGERWLSQLDRIIPELEHAWHITAGEAMSGGTHAFVAPALGADGREYVLKVDIPDMSEAEFMQEVRTLQLADGHGYVRLYAFDASRRATLLEKLGRRLKTLELPVREQIEIICGALKQTWAMPVDGSGLPDGAASVNWFRSFIAGSWEALGKPCSRKVIDRAMEYLDLRESRLNPSEFVLLHGDAHNNNTLEAPGGGYKLIDPDGIFYEPAYDLGVLMREWPEEYAAHPVESGRARCALLHRLTGADEEAIWHWGYLQTVSTSLVLLQIGQKELAQNMLRTAQCWCAEQ